MGKLTDSFKNRPEYPAIAPLLTQFETEYERMKTENSDLQTRLLAAENELRKLQNLPPKKTRTEGDLPETQESILLFLAGKEGARVESVARNIRLGVDRTRVQLVEMQKERLVWLKGFHDKESEWRIGQEGRNYLTARQLTA